MIAYAHVPSPDALARHGLRSIWPRRLLRRPGASGLAMVSLAEWRSMRALAQNGVPMVTPVPYTTRVVAAIADARERTKVVFLADGIIEPHEAVALRAIDTALADAEAADLARKTARSIEDTNELTAWQQRQWRELHRDHGPRAA